MGYVDKKIFESSKVFYYKTYQKELNNIETITSNVVKEIRENGAYLVVGNSQSISKQNELVEFEEFVYEKYLGKDIVILYGNCHTGAVKRVLQSCKAFNMKYEIYPLKEIQEVSDSSYFESPVFRVCDVLIHQSIWEKNRYGKEYASSNIISKVKDTCKIIAMPNVYHLPICLFPQYYEKTELRYKNQTYFFRDKIIDEGIEAGKSLKQIAREYYEYKFDQKKICEDYFKFINKVREREKEWDISVADYINANIKTTLLFFEPNHPTGCLFNYYANIILKILGITNYEVDTIDNAVEMDSYQMPFLTEVGKALDIEYSTKGAEIRSTGVKIRKVKMDIQEYVNQYYASLWMCGEYGIKNQIISKVMWLLYRIQDIPLRVIHKLAKVINYLLKYRKTN